MKKVAFLILTLIAFVIADDKTIEDMATKFDTDVATVQACLDKDGIKMEELNTYFQKWREIKDDNINEETKQSFMKNINFVACLLEKSGMIVDTKFDVGKILESLEKEKTLQSSQKEVLTECMNSLNEDSKITLEDRVFGLMLCLVDSQDGDRR